MPLGSKRPHLHASLVTSSDYIFGNNRYTSSAGKTYQSTISAFFAYILGK